MPSEVGLLTSLESLQIGFHDVLNRGCQLVGPNACSGTMPTEIGLLTNLQDELDFGSNGFSGMIPSELGMLTQLSGLKLNSNNFSGTLPSELGQLTRLVELQAGWNPSLTGTVPIELSSLLPLLQEFGAQGTQLTGGFNEVFCAGVNGTNWSINVAADCESLLGQEQQSPEVECSCCQTCCHGASGCRSAIPIPGWTAPCGSHCKF
jgi:hypothetical protein